jgi:acyl carrier protein
MTQKLLDQAQPPAAEALSAPEAEVFVMPSSVSQQRFWMLDQLYPANSALNIPLAVQFDGPLDIEVLKRALNAIVARHEILRTSFATVDGVARQVIKSHVSIELPIIDLTAVREDKRTARIDEEMIAEAARPLSLAQAPVFRTVLLRLTPTYHVLMLTLHHIVGDGWSNGILVREVGVFYDALKHGKEPNLPPLAFQYADYALWQEEWIKSPQFQKQLDYWKDSLKGDLPVLDMPTDFPRQMGHTYTAYIESLLLPNALTDSLKRLCVDLDVTLFMVLYSTYLALLYRYTGQTEFMVGTTAANRNRSELEHLIGLFANPLILHPDFTGEISFRQLVVKMRDHSLEGFAYQEVPFEIVLENLQDKMSGGRQPMIQTHFLYQKAFMEPATYGDVTIKPLRSVSPGSTFELTYGIVERPEGIRLQMEYHTTLYKNATIRRLLRHFQRLLEAVVENPDTSISELALLTEEEHAKLEASVSAKPSASDPARTNVDPQSVLQTLQSRLTRHYRDEPGPRGASIEPPPGTTLVVLDRHLRLLPVGIPGGLYVGGVSSGAVPGNALVSGPRDVPTPIPLLHTDFVALNGEDGKIELLGRAKDFAQTNGFRINLRQIEAILAQAPGVAEAVATVFKQPTGGNQLVCYIITRPGLTPTEKELRAFLKGKISDFTLPAHILTVPLFPKDVHGDIVVELLPDPAQLVKPPTDEKIPLEAILYHQLIEIWKEILKVPSLTIEDNFFALGGNSLLALRMMGQIEKLSGRPLPLSLLLTGATIANLASYIVKANNESTEPMVAVQPKGSRPPLFFLHGDWAGGGFYCGRLSQQLGEDQPFYALPPYRSGKPTALTMQDMAAYHIAAIQEHRPHGPYVIGGYCIGAMLAIEMSRQLVQKGEKVSQLLLIDPPFWNTPWLRYVWPVVNVTGSALGWDLQKKIYYFDRYGVSFARWLKRSPENKIATLRRRLGFASTVSSSPITVGREPGEGEVEILTCLDYAVYFLAHRLYRSKALTVPATLFFPEEISPQRLAWIKDASQRARVKVKVEVLPGDHHTCITRHTPDLAEKIRVAIDEIGAI